MDKLELACSTIAAQRQTGKIVALRGFSAIHAWPLAHKLVANNVLVGGVAVFTAGNGIDAIGKDVSGEDDAKDPNWKNLNPLATSSCAALQKILTETAQPFNTMIVVPRTTANLSQVRSVMYSVAKLRSRRGLPNALLIVLLDLSNPDLQELDPACSALFSCVPIGPFRAVVRDWDNVTNVICASLRAFQSVHVEGLFPEETWKLANCVIGADLAGERLRPRLSPDQVWKIVDKWRKQGALERPSSRDEHSPLPCRAIVFSEREAVQSLGKEDGTQSNSCHSWQDKPFISTNREFLQTALYQTSVAVNLVIVQPRSPTDLVTAVDVMKSAQKYRALQHKEPVPIKLLVLNDPGLLDASMAMLTKALFDGPDGLAFANITV